MQLMAKQNSKSYHLPFLQKIRFMTKPPKPTIDKNRTVISACCAVAKLKMLLLPLLNDTMPSKTITAHPNIAIIANLHLLITHPTLLQLIKELKLTGSSNPKLFVSYYLPSAGWSYNPQVTLFFDSTNWLFVIPQSIPPG